ncbi:MAG: hypothetical protein CMO01_31125 [Thalassobius sp.]|nr:hypothetical protein [Thalassovita sp.]
MKIVVANQKGGAGKTTHCILFSNYLSLEKGKSILVIDMDFQSTIKSTWDEDRDLFDNESLYEVVDVDLANSTDVMNKLKDVDIPVVIDLPGKMDDDNLVPVIEQADLIITPFSYDKKTFRATHVFAQVVKHLNPKVPVVFLPNRLKAGVNYITKEQSNRELRVFGDIAPEISDRVAFQRVDTFSIPTDIKHQALKAYDFIYNNYMQVKYEEES